MISTALLAPHRLSKRLLSVSRVRCLSHSSSFPILRIARLPHSSRIPLARHPTTCILADRLRLRRPFSDSTSHAKPAQQSITDPDRPDLFYHLFIPPTPLSSTAPVFALSFLSSPPPTITSATVIGWLPASGEGEGAGLNDFVENDGFREVMHEAIKSALHDGIDEVQRNGAIQVGEGWMHIHDNRNIPALGRIGDPDDIIASVRVENGEILADTYQPMPSYRLCTADGVVQLTEGLASRLTELLEDRAREEARSTQSS